MLCGRIWRKARGLLLGGESLPPNILPIFPPVTLDATSLSGTPLSRTGARATTVTVTQETPGSVMTVETTLTEISASSDIVDTPETRASSGDLDTTEVPGALKMVVDFFLSMFHSDTGKRIHSYFDGIFCPNSQW